MSLIDIGQKKFNGLNVIEMMLIRNNCYFDIKKIHLDKLITMEHSYSRDWRPNDGAQNMITRSIMVHRPPLCPSCHVHSHDEGVDLEDFYSPPIPSYNEEAAKNSMEECGKISNNSKNLNSEETDWEVTINKYDWTSQQTQLFDRIIRIFDTDRLARLAHKERQHEPVLRRVVIDKSVQRIRQALGGISWDPKLTQWLHGILMDHLPPSYLGAYLDILQSLKAKLPTMVDKMIFGRPALPGSNQDILRPVLKRPWDPVVDHKSRKLPLQPIILIVPSAPVIGSVSSRLSKWYTLFSTMSSVVPVQCHIGGTNLNKQTIEFVTDQLMSMSRAKIQELKQEHPTRPIILVGFNAGAALALQISLVETVNCVICMGFGYNTMEGIRGTPDDLILDITVPILFVIGQNSSKVSQEEIETLREKIQAQCSLVVVGSADDLLRVGKNKRQIEGVTQTMVDNMIMDEVSEFATTCLVNPPGPRQQSPLTVVQTTAPSLTPITTTTPSTIVPNNGNLPALILSRNIIKTTNIGQGRKRKITQSSDGSTEVLTLTSPKIKVPKIAGRPRANRALQTVDRSQQQTSLSHVTTEALNMAIQSILPETEQKTITTTPMMSTKLIETIQPSSGKMMTSYEIVPTTQLTSSGHQIQNIKNSKLQIRQIPSTSTSSSTTGQKVTGTPIMLPMLQRTIQKVKVIPPNQFLQLKPPFGTTQKVYTLKTTPQQQQKNNNQPQQLYTLKTQTIDGQQIRGNKIYTVKSGTQIVPMSISTSSGSTISTTNSTINQQPIILNSNKFTVMKQTATNESKHPDLSNTSIFDIPIVFADNEGNIQETQPIVTTQSTTSPIIINTSQHQINDNTINRNNIIINNLMQKKTNKVVLINRNAVKVGQQNIITKNQMPQLKYTKVLMPKQDDINSSSGNIVISNSSIASTSSIDATKVFTPISVSNKVEILNSSLGKPSSTTKFHPIIINVDSEKNPMKNMIKVGETQIKPTNTILIKSGGLKQIPLLKSGILNRNLTVRKVVNIVQQKPVASVTSPPAEVFQKESNE